jgi:hypothetical protein
MRASPLFGLSACLAFGSCVTISQVPCSMGTLRTHIEGIDIPHIANAPFRAKVVVNWDEPLPGGGTVSKTYYTMVARDSQGRVRRETRNFIPADSSDEPPLRTFTVTDPVSGTSTTCTEATMRCAIRTFRRRIDYADDSENGLSRSSGQEKRTPLGKQTMQNVSVIGTRETSSDLPGSQVDGSASISSTEVWYSPDLHIDLSVIHSNPRLGRVTLTVTDLVQGEPDASWFAVPSGYATRNSSTH